MDHFGISVGVSPREPLARVGELAAQVEAHGFEALWVIDFQAGMKDAYAALDLAAIATSRLLLGPGVTNLTTRHPTVTANAMAALDELSGGRALLGLGAGWSAVLAAGSSPVRLAALRDGIVMLRRLMDGEEVAVGSEGRTVRLPTAGRRIPILVAAAQPGMLRMAGEVADGVILMGAADPVFCEWQLAYIREGLERAGRSRSSFTVDLQVTMSMRDDPSAALADVRAWATSQAATFASWKEVPPSYEKFREEFDRAAGSYHLTDHLSLHAPHQTAVSDGFVQAVAVAGDESYCLRRLRALPADVDRITFALLSGGREARLRQLSERVLPALR